MHHDSLSYNKYYKLRSEQSRIAGLAASITEAMRQYCYAKHGVDIVLREDASKLPTTFLGTKRRHQLKRNNYHDTKPAVILKRARIN